MAQNSNPNRNVWLAGGVTLAVILVGTAIISGPSIVSCLGSDTGFGTCLRGKMSDAGLVPQPAANASGESGSETAEAPSSAVQAETSPDAQAGAGNGSGAASSLLAPQLGLVRAEPDGSLVIAGSAAPGSTVEIYANDTLLGTATTEPSGDWVLVPDAPLAPGGYEIRVVDPKQNKASEQSVVVAINQDKKTEPLVVASTPGKASEVLQGLKAPQQTAMAEPQAGVSQSASTTEAPAAETAPQPTAEASSETAPAAPEPTPAATAAAVEAPAQNSAPSSETPQAAQNESQGGGEGTDQTGSSNPTKVANAETAPPAAGNGTDVVGDVAGLQKRIDALGASNPPTIDAIEIDGNKNFFAGSGANGATVRVYVDNKFVGDATVANGHWLLETDKVLAEKSQRVRVDQLVTGSAEVASRAEVEFIFKAPNGETSAGAATAVADAGNVTVPVPDFSLDSSVPSLPTTSEQVQPSPEATSETGAPPATAEAPTAVAQSGPAVQVPQADFSINTEEPAPISVASAQTGAQPTGSAQSGSGEAGVSSPDQSGSQNVNPEPAAAAPTIMPTPDFAIDTGIPVVVGGTGALGTATMTAQAEGTSGANDNQATETPAPAQNATAVAPTAPIIVPVPDFSINTEAPAPVSGSGATDTAASQAPAAEAQGEVPTMVAEPVGNPEDQRFSAGKAIIRRGDNLWTIARRVYGEGLRYTTIYQANKDQIRNPDLIYPGQVFALPEAEQ